VQLKEAISAGSRAANGDSPQRRAYADDRISFDPWHALEAHRPLGGIQRARRIAYRTLAKERFERNDRSFAEPRSAADLPK